MGGESSSSSAGMIGSGVMSTPAYLEAVDEPELEEEGAVSFRVVGPQPNQYSAVS